MKSFARALALGLVPLSLACQARPPTQTVPTVVARDTHEGLNSVLWVQTSAEYNASCVSVYEQAKAALVRGLTDKAWTAAPEQTGDFRKLPPAVVLDLDETVFDNARFQGQLVADRAPYSEAAWETWVARADAGAVPGAADFLRFARQRGVAIFYISNRLNTHEKATAANLVKLGMPVDAAGERILSKDERPEWTSEKSTRRASIAATHRIVLLVGDDLGDFVMGSRDLPEKRLELARAHAKQWGTRWFLLPNPMYGSWDRATYGHDGSLSDAEILKRKLGLVKGF